MPCPRRLASNTFVFLPAAAPLQEEEQLKSANESVQQELEGVSQQLAELKTQQDRVLADINELKKAAAQHGTQGACLAWLVKGPMRVVWPQLSHGCCSDGNSWVFPGQTYVA